MKEKDINKAEWCNPKNWSNGFLPFYFSRLDTRVFVPRRVFNDGETAPNGYPAIGLLGTTVNCGNKRAGVWRIVLLLALPGLWGDFLLNRMPVVAVTTWSREALDGRHARSLTLPWSPPSSPPPKPVFIRVPCMQSPFRAIENPPRKSEAPVSLPFARHTTAPAPPMQVFINCQGLTRMAPSQMPRTRPP